MNKFIEKWMTFVSVLHFFTRVNSECSRFNIVCVRAVKNPELSKTFKTKLLEKIVQIFENTNYFYNNIYLRACLHVKFHPGIKSSLSMVKCLLLFTRSCRDEISSRDERQGWNFVPGWNFKMSMFFINFWRMYLNMLSKVNVFEHNESMNVMKHKVSL